MKRSEPMCNATSLKGWWIIFDIDPGHYRTGQIVAIVEADTPVIRSQLLPNGPFVMQALCPHILFEDNTLLFRSKQELDECLKWMVDDGRPKVVALPSRKAGGDDEAA